MKLVTKEIFCGLRSRIGKVWFCGTILFAYLIFTAGSSNAVMINVEVSFADGGLSIVSGNLEVQDDELVSGVQIEISVTPGGWSLMEVNSGEVATETGKEVFASAFGEVVKVLVVGFNNQTMSSGRLFSLLIKLNENVTLEETKFAIRNLVFSSPEGKAVEGSSSLVNHSSISNTEGEKENSSSVSEDIVPSNSTDNEKDESNFDFSATITNHSSGSVVNKEYRRLTNTTTSHSSTSESKVGFSNGYFANYLPYGYEETKDIPSNKHLISTGEPVVVGINQSAVIPKIVTSVKKYREDLNNEFIHNGLSKRDSLGLYTLRGSTNSDSGYKLQNSGIRSVVYSSSDKINEVKKDLDISFSPVVSTSGGEFEISRNLNTPETRRAGWTGIKTVTSQESISIYEGLHGIIWVSFFITTFLIAMNFLPRVVILFQKKILRK